MTMKSSTSVSDIHMKFGAQGRSNEGEGEDWDLRSVEYPAGAKTSIQRKRSATLKNCAINVNSTLGCLRVAQTVCNLSVAGGCVERDCGRGGITPPPPPTLPQPSPSPRSLSPPLQPQGAPSGRRVRALATSRPRPRPPRSPPPQLSPVPRPRPKRAFAERRGRGHQWYRRRQTPAPARRRR